MNPQAPPSPFNPVAAFSALLIGIVVTLANRVSWSALSPVLVHHIRKRLWRIKLRIERIAALVGDGKYIPQQPRTPANPASNPARKPPPPSLPEMRRFNWLAGILPDIPPLRGTFLHQLHHPDMVALIEAAPAAMIPPLRSLCWTLGLPPPPILARPKRPQRRDESPPPPVGSGSEADQGCGDASPGASEPAPLKPKPLHENGLWAERPKRRTSIPRPTPKPA